MENWQFAILQVVVALVVLLILYIITLAVLNIDALVSTTTLQVKQREVTTLVDGYAGPSFLQEVNFNTVNPFVENYRRINRSMNLGGGAQFTYQLWLKVENTDPNLYKDLILFHKGDKKKFQVGYYAPSAPAAASYNLKVQLPADMWVACPQVRFGNSFSDIRVRFNTNNDVYNEIAMTMDSDGEPSSRKNLLSTLPVNWTLLTFVFEDNFSLYSNAENGVKFTFYVNDVPYWSESASSFPGFRNAALKQNDGNFYMLPNANAMSEFLKVGNMKYYNYALTQSDVQNVFVKGPPTHEAKATDSPATMPSYITSLNKIDVNNF